MNSSRHEGSPIFFMSLNRYASTDTIPNPFTRPIMGSFWVSARSFEGLPEALEPLEKKHE